MSTTDAPQAGFVSEIKKMFLVSSSYPVIDSSFFEDAPILLTGKAVVPTSVEAAFRGLCDVEAWGAWIPRCKSVTSTGDGPLREGSTHTVRRRGKPAYDEQVVELEAPFRLTTSVIRGREGGLARGGQEFLLRPLSAGSTELTWRYGAEPTRFAGWSTPVMKLLMRVHPLAPKMQNRLPEAFATYMSAHASRYASA